MAEHVYRPQSSAASTPSQSSGLPPIGVAPPPAPASGGHAVEEVKPKIHGFASGRPTESVESRWKRPLQKSGTGATHVRTFSGSLTAHGLEYLDRHINEWLDAHPEAEVKFATLQVGDMPTATGREPALIAQVWI
ncbi:MAG: hypothetical protein HEQ23_00255 [Tepidisphaera sp.]|jgi:hypothetical protein